MIGSGVAAGYGGFSPGRGALALIVALSLQVGVNYANDYSDGIRDTDAVGKRVGPVRLVGSGLAAPRQVMLAAFACFAVAAAAGLALAALTSWWLVPVGAGCVLGAWCYTGGPRPYGYMGLGEVAVFVFFGVVAVTGAARTPATIVNWAGDEVSSIEEWCAYLAKLTGLDLRFVSTAHALSSVTCDLTRMHELVGHTQVKWQDGLARMVQACHPELLNG